MRHRGSQYWAWSDCQLPSRLHDEALSDGTQLNVQVRVSRHGVTQLFIGLYEGGGTMMFEEYYDSLLDETISHALVWGVNRARALAIGSVTAVSEPTRQRAL
ncbi:hypothetical protein NVV94_14615 [Pseudomonas sp. LS1212]|uniref:hypothetical protein n=1 Tax=Pseudomonas sp. LS1212 TaxID=2972478 RepID=UPI00215BA9DA|nr:hypothetical protein [Pseudomonas sp. LS1212]UVJ41932.1 hypothetical protein NVV94_14615 [Pseudomonas sp. LS1212]